jgi:hypothetical protein
MLIPEQEIEKIFTKIVNKSASGSISVAICVAYDIDSLCSSQILMSLLKSEDIQYKLSIVYGYSDLETIS